MEQPCGLESHPAKLAAAGTESCVAQRRLTLRSVDRERGSCVIELRNSYYSEGRRRPECGVSTEARVPCVEASAGSMSGADAQQGCQGTWEALASPTSNEPAGQIRLTKGLARRGCVPPRRERTKDAGVGTVGEGRPSEAGRTSVVRAHALYL